jgi:hypothetical protein
MSRWIFRAPGLKRFHYVRIRLSHCRKYLHPVTLQQLC